MANTRWRAICKITMKRKHIPYFCILTVEKNGKYYRRVKFIEKDDLERCKKIYGENLEVII